MTPEFESRRQRRLAENVSVESVLAPSLPSVQERVEQLYRANSSAPEIAPETATTLRSEPVAARASASLPAPSPAQSATPPLSRRELRLQQSSSEPLASSAPTPANLPATLSPASSSLASTDPSTPPPAATFSLQPAASLSPAPAPAPPGSSLGSPWAASGTVAPSVSAPPPSRRQMRDQLRQSSQEIFDSAPLTESKLNREALGAPSSVAAASAEPYLAKSTPNPEVSFAAPALDSPRSDSSLTPMFETSSGFSLDTTTNSIVLPVTPDALSGALLIESGVTLKTGSIELPNLNAGTGSIALPAAAQIADDALRLDSATTFVTSISPIAAKDLIKRNPKMGFTPVKSKGTQGQLFYGLTTSFLMLTVGGLLVVAWMYGLIK